MNKIYTVVYNFNDRATASHNIQEGFFSATRRVFTASHEKSCLHFAPIDWNNGAADPLKDGSRLGPFQRAEALTDPTNGPTISWLCLSKGFGYMDVRLTLHSVRRAG